MKAPRVSWDTIRNWFFAGVAFFLLGSFAIFTRNVFGDDADEWSVIDREIMLQVAELRRPWLNGAITDITALASIAVLSM
ncbi:MAG TPA: hypothetical protein VFV50_18675, partial [Bdellovibrionales bacterium]|nr:hypothetical protein [Bdellovibrionales bacterium]